MSTASCWPNVPSAVRDFFDQDQVERICPGEVEETVKALTGASCVVLMSWMIRTSEISRSIGARSSATRTRVECSLQQAKRTSTLRRDVPSSWRVICHKKSFRTAGVSRASSRPACGGRSSDPPQDWPLALCDASGVRSDEGVPNTLHVVDEIPDAAGMMRDMPGEDSLLAAAIFHYSPDHRWWYFSNMTRDEGSAPQSSTTAT